MNGLAIDSGVLPACARFERGGLVRAWFDREPRGEGLEWIVVEQWQFRGMQDLAKATKLIKMMTGGLLAAGHASAWGAPVTLVTPREWKGTEPKPLQHARMFFATHAMGCTQRSTLVYTCRVCHGAPILTPLERDLLGGDATGHAITAAVDKGAMSRWRISGAECYPRKFTTHNLLDATAIGCEHLGRLEKRS